MATVVVQFQVTLKAIHCGYNTVELALKEGQDQRVIWLEIFIAPNADPAAI